MQSLLLQKEMRHISMTIGRAEAERIIDDRFEEAHEEHEDEQPS